MGMRGTHTIKGTLQARCRRARLLEANVHEALGLARRVDRRREGAPRGGERGAHPPESTAAVHAGGHGARQPATGQARARCPAAPRHGQRDFLPWRRGRRAGRGALLRLILRRGCTARLGRNMLLGAARLRPHGWRCALRRCCALRGRGLRGRGQVEHGHPEHMPLVRAVPPLGAGGAAGGAVPGAVPGAAPGGRADPPLWAVPSRRRWAAPPSQPQARAGGGCGRRRAVRPAPDLGTVRDCSAAGVESLLHRVLVDVGDATDRAARLLGRGRGAVQTGRGSG